MWRAAGEWLNELLFRWETTRLLLRRFEVEGHGNAAAARVRRRALRPPASPPEAGRKGRHLPPGAGGPGPARLHRPSGAGRVSDDYERGLKLERIDDYRWQLPVSARPGMRVPGLVFTIRA